MGKNIVICVDGTGNEYGDNNTNIVKLFRVLQREPSVQVAYYDPGVGTMSAPGLFSKPAKAISKAMGMAFGFGLTANLEDAYRYLMNNFAEGDKIYLFGFSRGAYIVRALASMIHVVGILEKGSENLIPYAWQLFRKYSKTTAHICGGFQATYSKRSKVEFVGVFDTVSSVGWIYNPVSLPFTRTNPDICVFRHALAVDERRCFFRQNLFFDEHHLADVKQVWFAGVHSDIGGGYPEAESGLAKLTLEWMLGEAENHGLKIHLPKYNEVLGKFPSPNGELFAQPDATGLLHVSLKGFWRIAEYLPKRYWDISRKPYVRRWKIPCGRPRFISENSALHESVEERKAKIPNYLPPNLPKIYTIERTRKL